MTGTVQNTFSFNGNQLDLQPSEHTWMGRSQYGIDGSGHTLFPAIRQYQLQWAVMSPSEFYEIVNLYNSYSSGTVVASLPKWGAQTYQFYAYSGCVFEEPTYQGFFENQYMNVTLVISSIRT